MILSLFRQETEKEILNILLILSNQKAFPTGSTCHRFTCLCQGLKARLSQKTDQDFAVLIALEWNDFRHEIKILVAVKKEKVVLQSNLRD